MSVEMGVWRIDQGVRLVKTGFDYENKLESILNDHIELVSPNWFVIGRQVHTEHGGIIDLLAMDGDANLVVLELKRERTSRDIVAQLLDYGSWVSQLEIEQITKIHNEYLKRWRGSPDMPLSDGFRSRFGIPLPDEINVSHQLVIVAVTLDPATERIVRYLTEKYGVPINAVFFKVFRDEGREYISRAWLQDPVEVIEHSKLEIRRDWNGEYYVSFGYPLDVVKDGLTRGYIVAGGGAWYSRTLRMLEPNARIWVYLPGSGYVGVGRVSSAMQPVDEFTVENAEGRRVPIIEVSQAAATLNKAADNLETTDYLVGVNWLKTVEPEEGIWEKGLFANQNSVARPRVAKWEYTIERLKSCFGIK